MSVRYSLQRHGQIESGLSSADLEARANSSGLGPEDKVCIEGTGKWISAAELRGLWIPSIPVAREVPKRLEFRRWSTVLLFTLFMGVGQVGGVRNQQPTACWSGVRWGVVASGVAYVLGEFLEHRSPLHARKRRGT